MDVSLRMPEPAQRPMFYSDALPYKNNPPAMRYEILSGPDDRPRDGGGKDKGEERDGCCRCC